MLIIQIDSAVNLKQMLQNNHILAKIGADTADSEPMFIPCSAEDDDDDEPLPGGLAGAPVGVSGLAEIRQPRTLQGSFSAVSKPNFARKYAFESSRRDLHNTVLCTALKDLHIWAEVPKILLNFHENC